MEPYNHHVSGFFAHRDAAEEALSQLLQRGMRSEQLQIVAGGADAPPAPTPQARSNKVLKDMLVDICIGAAVGIAVGALIAMAMAGSEVSLFHASPFLAPFSLMGMGGFVGGFLGSVIGASAGAGRHHGRFAKLVEKSITHGDVVLVAQTRNEEETSMARDVLRATTGLVKDIDMAGTPANPAWL